MKAYVVVIENEDRVMRLLDELVARTAREEGAGRPSRDASPLLDQPGAPLTWRALELDPTRHCVCVEQVEVPLTRLEFDLLHLLMRNRGRTLTRRELIDHLWGYEYEGYGKAINGHVMNLRRKLAADCIETVRGVGYRFTAKN